MQFMNEQLKNCALKAHKNVKGKNCVQELFLKTGESTCRQAGLSRATLEFSLGFPSISPYEI